MQKSNQVACIVCVYESVSIEEMQGAAAKPLSLFRQHPEDVPGPHVGVDTPTTPTYWSQVRRNGRSVGLQPACTGAGQQSLILRPLLAL